MNGSNVLNLKVYPNPIKRNLNLTFFGAAHQELAIHVYDTGGRLIIEENHFVETIGQQELKLNVSRLSEGTYTVQISNGILSDQKRFIKQ